MPYWVPSQTTAATTNVTPLFYVNVACATATATVTAATASTWCPYDEVSFGQDRVYHYVPPPLTDQQLYENAVREHDTQEAARIQARMEETERARREVEERARQERQRQAGATTRATELLMEHLTPTQRDTFRNSGWFVVEGGRTKTRYRIREGSLVGNIDVLGSLNNPLHRLCGHVPSGMMPMADHLLAQKLMLEYAEDDFLRIANRH